MADNYLERRMEDLRSGKLQASNKSTTSYRAPIKRFTGRRVVVTGGANGIGAEIVREFRKEGATVDIIDIDRTNGTKLAQATGACYRPTDISNPEEYAQCLKDIIAHRGDIDVLINDAAIVDFVSLIENDNERFLHSLQTNVVPIFVGAKVLAMHREATTEDSNQFGGRIINIASTRAFMSESGTENYSASKGAVVSLTHSLMMSLAKYKITVNSISPGWIHTGNIQDLSEADHAQHPSGRVGIPSDIAKICLFIASPDSQFLNGENITIDGGHTHKMWYV